MQSNEPIHILYLADDPPAAAEGADRLEERDERFDVRIVDSETAEGALASGAERVDCAVVDDGDETVTLVRTLREVRPSLPIVLRIDGSKPEREGDGSPIEDAVDAGATGVVPSGVDADGAVLANRIADAVLARRGSPERDRRKLERLQEMTRELMDAPAESIPEQAVAFARGVLDLPVTALALEEDGELVVVAATEEAEELFATLPSFNGEDGLSRHTFEAGRPTVVADAREHPHTADPESPVRSVGIFPLGEHGVLITGSTEPDVFDETDADFGNLLAASVESALDRADRERELRERSDELAQITQTLEAVIEAAPVPIVALDDQRRVELWNPAAEEVFGWSAEDVGGERAPMVPSERREQFQELIELVLSGETVESEEVVRRTRDGKRREFQLSTAPLREADGTIRGSLGIFLDISEHKAHERRLSALHETTRELMRASDRDRIAEIASRAMTDVLDHPLNAVRYANEERSTLELAAIPERATDQFGERPAYDVTDSDAGVAYREGQTVQSTGTLDDGDTYHRVYVPLGEHGVLSLGSEEPLEQTDVQLAEVLGANVEAALERVERAQQLERQNERLEEFASVVSHDLRSPLNVAQGHLELVREQYDDESLDRVAEAHDRMGELIDAVLALARQGQTVGETEPTDVGEIARQAWSVTSTSTASLELREPGTVAADPDRLRQLLENLFRNSVEHAGPDVTVTVGSLPDGGFYVADDGPGLDAPEKAFQRGYSGSDSSGFGLAIVSEIAGAHGWHVEATESETGGARFEIHPDESAAGGG